MDNNDMKDTSVDDALENSRPGEPTPQASNDPFIQQNDNPAAPATDVPNLNYPQVQPQTDSLPDSDEVYEEGTTTAANPLSSDAAAQDDEVFDPNAEQTL